MKKSLAILLLICLFVEVIGFYFVFLLRRDAVKQEAWSYLQEHRQNNYAQVLSFPIQSLSTNEMPAWENEKEFSWKGEMYDVIEKKEVKGKLLITCISDKKETSLIKDFEKDLAGNTPGKNSKGNTDQLIKLLTTPYLFLPGHGDLHHLALLQEFNDYYNLQLTTHSQDILTPPPQIG